MWIVNRDYEMHLWFFRGEVQKIQFKIFFQHNVKHFQSHNSVAVACIRVNMKWWLVNKLFYMFQPAMIDFSPPAAVSWCSLLRPFQPLRDKILMFSCTEQSTCSTIFRRLVDFNLVVEIMFIVYTKHTVMYMLLSLSYRAFHSFLFFWKFIMITQKIL